MNRIILLWILILTGGAAARAQTNPAPAATPKTTPRISFDSTTYNFGRAKSGEVIKHDFVFTNSGTATLEIMDVKPGCGCTTAGAWDKKVEPGKTGIIPLQFNSTGYSGQLSKSATVACNDAVQPNLILQITGTVWKPIDITPSMATFNLCSDAPTNETKALHIVSNLEELITLSDLQCGNASFKAELKEAKPGKEFDLLVTAVPPFAAPTVFSTISLKTSSTQAPLLSVTAYALVQQAVTVSPQQVALPSGPLKSPFTSAVLVRNNSTNMLELADVRLDLPGVDVIVAQLQTGRLYSITVNFPAGFQMEAGQKPELTFKSNHPRFPALKVPVVQMRSADAVASSPPPAMVAPAQLQTVSPLRPPATRPLPSPAPPPAGK